MKTIEELVTSPAPWETDIGESCCLVEARGGSTICSTGSSETQDFETDAADARLITAAPELYEALRNIVDSECEDCNSWCDGGCTVDAGLCIYQKYRAALEKAGGAE